ncbi:MAG TPA: DUF922 domain-containing protein [Longimicrobiales bacterium]|nr:DUF922 domain-containing protein [Longimicrobiales bacterium]
MSRSTCRPGLVRWGLCAVVGAAWLASSASAEAEPDRPGGAESLRVGPVRPPRHGLRVVLDERRFPVEGATPEGVMGSVEARRIGQDRGLTAHGLARYRVEPKWTFFATERQCFMDAVGIDVEVMVDLPLWTGYAASPSAARGWWREYLADLTEHEYAHRDAVLAAMGDLHRELTFLAAGDCDTLNTSARRAMERAWDVLQEVQEDLDRAFHAEAGSPIQEG